MMRKPTDNEILLAEQRLARARKEVVEGAVRVQAEFRATLARPSTLVGVAVAGGLLGYWLFKPTRRPRRPARRVKARRAEDRTAAETSTSLASIVVAYAMRYAMHRLPAIGMKLAEKTFQSKAKPVEPPRAVDTVPIGRPATATLH